MGRRFEFRRLNALVRSTSSRNRQRQTKRGSLSRKGRAVLILLSAPGAILSSVYTAAGAALCQLGLFPGEFAPFGTSVDDLASAARSFTATLRYLADLSFFLYICIFSRLWPHGKARTRITITQWAVRPDLGFLPSCRTGQPRV